MVLTNLNTMQNLSPGIIRWPLLLPKATCERGGKRGLRIKKYNLWLKRKIQPEVANIKRQAASNA